MTDVSWLRELREAATPGPWRNEGWDDHPGDQGWWVHGGGPAGSSDERAVAVTFSLLPDDEGEADACLIALAPDLARLLADAAEILGTLHRGPFAPDVCGTCELIASLAALKPKEDG